MVSLQRYTQKGEFVKKIKNATGIFKSNSFQGSQLWKLDENTLQNKREFWESDQEWSFKTKDDLIYIENISQEKFLESSSDGDVILKDFEEDKAQQLWKKGKIDAEGYFTLESQNPDSFTLHTGYIEVIMQGKCGRNTETTFDNK